MRVPGLLVGVVCLSAAFNVQGVVADQSSPKPDRTTVHTNYGPPPASLDDLWARAPVVVRGVVEATHVRRATPTGKPVVVTDQRVKVLEVLKSDGRLKAAQIHVLQYAGTLVADGQEITMDPGKMPVLAPGQEAVFFLEPWPNAAGYALTGGPHGLYLTDEESVSIPPFMQPSLGGKAHVSKSEFLAAVRRQAQQK